MLGMSASNQTPKKGNQPKPNTKPKTAQKRRRKRRYDPVRLGIVIVAALAIVITLIFSVRALFHRPSKKDDESLASSSEISTLVTEISDAMGSVVNGSAMEFNLLDFKNNLYTAVVDQPNSLADLEAQINDYLTSKNINPAQVSWAVEDLVTKEIIESDNARQSFTAASTYKLPICVYYYEEIAAGRMNASDQLEYTEEMREDEDDENLNQPIHRKYKVGDKIPIDELLEAALLYSDNIAGHMLYSNMGGYQEFKKIVAKYSDVPQSASFFEESSNSLNADYMMRLLEHIYYTPGTFNDLKYWLQYTAYDTFLNRTVPGTYIQKIGNINAVRNAVGIYNGMTPFTLSVYTEVSKKDGMDILADLGELVLRYFQNRYASGFYEGMDLSQFSTLNAQMSSPYDVIALRDGPNGQKLPDMTPEDLKKMSEAIQEELNGEEGENEVSEEKAASDSKTSSKSDSQTE